MSNQYDFIDEFAVLTEDYSDNKNLQIIAISLDAEIYKWEDCIKNDTTYCEHLCDGKAWESETVKKLGITTIPTYIVADKKHKIIGRGNSLKDLNNELQKLIE